MPSSITRTVDGSWSNNPGSDASRKEKDIPTFPKVNVTKETAKSSSTNNHRHQQRKPRPSGSKRTPENEARDAAESSSIFSSDFSEFLKECDNLGYKPSYKVHKPSCSCPKIQAFRSTLSKKLQEDQLKGLMVAPDVKKTKVVYTYPGTGGEEFEQDPLAAEIKLRQQLYPPTDSKGVDSSCFKMSCAQCLLEHQPNGFACVSCPSQSTVNFARDLARESVARNNKQQKVLHSDHADYICTLPRRLLWNILDKNVTQDQKALASKQLVERLSDENGIAVDSLQPGASAPRIELGHHLKQLLFLTKEDVDADSSFWFVLVYGNKNNNRIPSWTIDLPGGKRHLGETSFQGATRETEEESSLMINEQWIVGERYEKDCNKYYLLRPPADLILQDLETRDFWSKPGFCKEPELLQEM